MQVVLVMFRPEGDRRSFSITRDVTVVGRREDCDFRIPLGEISRKHCRLIKDQDALRLEDLGSSNGTFHNGERVQEAVLQPGDTMQVGSVVFVVQIDGVPADEELQPIVAGRGTAAQPDAVDESAIGVTQDRHADDSMIPLEDAGASVASHASGNGDGRAQDSHSDSDIAAEGEFDPMTILDSNDSATPQEPVTFDLGESATGEAP
jgi:pSer/pThr/pTyr-binding forkhead associated (FHA) protein